MVEWLEWMLVEQENPGTIQPLSLMYLSAQV